MEIKDKNGKVVAMVTAMNSEGGPTDEGIWLEVQADDGTKPTLCLIKSQGYRQPGDWFLGVYRDARSKDIRACDLAIRFSVNDGVTLQVAQNGKVKVVNLFDLIPDDSI